MTMGIDRDDESMNGAAELAARMLRADVAVRPEWREALIARIEADAPVARRGWTISPVWAIAASVLFLILGAAGATVAIESRARERSSPDRAWRRHPFVLCMWRLAQPRCLSWATSISGIRPPCRSGV